LFCILCENVLTTLFPLQLEKLLQKNYYLHQSAKDGYRSYLQSYASYSLKRIFDVNALDLAKVGKAFGFSVPPRVNVSFGGGKGGTGKNGTKRQRHEDEDEWEELPVPGSELDVPDNVEQERVRDLGRQKEKRRRIETFGQKKVDREVYRNNKKVRGTGGEQWSR
jgi:ATP-dependent RNA helicase DDX18/HAS1